MNSLFGFVLLLSNKNKQGNKFMSVYLVLNISCINLFNLKYFEK
jgi:hypothetical protein